MRTFVFQNLTDKIGLKTGGYFWLPEQYDMENKANLTSAEL